MRYGSYLYVYIYIHIYICVITHIYTYIYTYMTWLIRMWHDSFIYDMTPSYVTWRIHMWHASFIFDMTLSRVTCLIHIWHDSFTCDMTHSYVTWLIHMRHDSFICDMTHSYVTWLIHMWHDSFICDMTHNPSRGIVSLKISFFWQSPNHIYSHSCVLQPGIHAVARNLGWLVLFLLFFWRFAVRNTCKEQRCCGSCYISFYISARNKGVAGHLLLPRCRACHLFFLTVRNKCQEQSSRGTFHTLPPHPWRETCFILYISFLFLFVFLQSGIHARNEAVAGHLVPYSHDEGYAWFHPTSAFRLLSNWGLCTHILMCICIVHTYIG